MADADLDGFRDDVDNCPVNSNENQSDTNNNGVGDVCDAAPVIAAELSASVDEDGSVVIDLSQGATDAEGDSLSYSVGGLSLEGPVYLFTPEANENGAQTIDYTVSDGTSIIAGVVNITIAPQNDPGLVSISGDATQDQTLTATVIDDIDGLVNAIISYVWSDDSGVIEGEIDSTLTLTQDQVGNTITVSASYTDDEGFQETVVSEATEAVEDINDQPSGELSLTGVAREDETVSVITDGLSDPDGSIVIVAYQWSSNGDPIATATEAEFTIPAELVGTTLSVDVTFTDNVFTNAVNTANTSFDSVVANANDVATGTVTISSTSPAEGDGLVVSLENIQDEDGLTNVEYTYQWLADGEEISGATASTFIPGQQHVNSALSVEVSFVDDFGSAESLTSTETSAVANVNDAPMGSVSISGSAVVGQELTASNNLTDEDGIGEISYEWFLNGVTTSVTGSSYTVQPADVDGEITVEANYVDTFGEQENIESNFVTGLAEPVEFDTSLVGSWDFHIEESGTYDKTILSLTATGEFFFFNVNSVDEDACRENGYEYGTYERVGNDINLTRVIDTSGCVGLFDSTENQTEATFTITDEQTTSITASIFDPIDDPQGTNPEVLNWTRIQTNSDSIVGSWHEVYEGPQGNLSNLLLFLGDGRMYAMDADPNDTQENDFFYGDYTYDGSVFTRTWIFEGFPDNTFAENTNTQITANRLIFSVDDSLGRNVPDLENAGAPLVFTEAELDIGFTWYFVGPFDDCSSEWVVEEMNFDATGYSLDTCGSGIGGEVDEAYNVLASGIVNLVTYAEYVKRMSFDPELQAYLNCWKDTELAASDCAEENQGYAFLSRADAQAYADDQDASNSIDLTQYTISSTMTNSDCPGVDTLGWDYTFTETDITFSGSDGINTSNGVCTASPEEAFVEPIADQLNYLGSFWACENYPVCTVSELNRTYDGLDYDGDEDVFITISHAPGTNTITWVQDEDLGSIWTEIITLTPKSASFSSLTTGTYQSHVVGDELPTLFKINNDGSGTWSYGINESGPITWSVNSDGVLKMVFTDTGGTEDYQLTSGTVLDGNVSIAFSNEPLKDATWVKVDTLACGYQSGSPIDTYNEFIGLVNNCNSIDVTNGDIIGSWNSSDGGSITFNNDGSGIYQTGTTTNFSWTITNNVVVLSNPGDYLEHWVFTINQDYPVYIYAEDSGDWGADLSVANPDIPDGVIFHTTLTPN